MASMAFMPFTSMPIPAPIGLYCFARSSTYNITVWSCKPMSQQKLMLNAHMHPWHCHGDHLTSLPSTQHLVLLTSKSR